MKIKTLLPPNASSSEIALENTHAERIESLPVPIRKIRRPLLTPEKFIPWMAWDNGVTYWDENWAEWQKRSVIKNAIPVNKKRGTLGAVKQALAAVDRYIDVIEWFSDTPPAAPYTFRVLVNGSSITADELQRIASQVNDAKNARSLLSDIRIGVQTIEGKYYIGGAVTVMQTVTIKAKRNG